MSETSKLEALLKKLCEKAFDNEYDGMPNIADTSIMIEHRKIKLAGHVEKENLSKSVMLMAVNLARIEEHNLYGALIGYIEGEYTQETIKKDLMESYEGLIILLLKILDKMKVEGKENA